MKNIFFALICSLCSIVLVAQTSTPYQVTVSGKGKQSVIFLPGYSCSADVWKETVAKFSPAYTCHLFTFAGFAGVTPQANPDLHDWAQAVAKYIADNRLDKPIIIGHSLGGGLALWIAAENPDKIGKIVVVDALPCISAVYNPEFKSQPTPDCSAMIGQFEKMDESTFKVNQYRNVRMLVADTSKVETVTQWGLRSDRKTLGKIYCDFANTDLREKIAAIQCPALILLEASFKNYSATMTEQYKNLKTARLAYANQGLHFIMYDDPQWYLDQLQSFLK
jgi:pimeloyl-ACP methyl ester carboxylesterase